MGRVTETWSFYGEAMLEQHQPRRRPADARRADAKDLCYHSARPVDLLAEKKTRVVTDVSYILAVKDDSISGF